MQLQLSWETVPGLQGLRCGGFRAIPTGDPDSVRGVAILCDEAAQAERLLHGLEEHFRSKWFSNDAAAFEAVKVFVLEWAAGTREK